MKHEKFKKIAIYVQIFVLLLYWVLDALERFPADKFNDLRDNGDNEPEPETDEPGNDSEPFVEQIANEPAKQKSDNSDK